MRCLLWPSLTDAHDSLVAISKTSSRAVGKQEQKHVMGVPSGWYHKAKQIPVFEVYKVDQAMSCIRNMSGARSSSLRKDHQDRQGHSCQAWLFIPIAL